MKLKLWLVSTCLLVITLLLATATYAAPVGKFIMVQGYVDLLKQGKLPALAVKVNDGVETGDVIRTKSRSKTQVVFVDDTTLTVGAESRVAVADYMYDGRQRRASISVFRGLVHTVVRKILNIQEPDFIMQTATAAVGVRGTEWYTLIKPNSTLVYLPQGRLAVETRNPHNLLLEEMFWVEIFKERITPPRRITPADLDLLGKLMDSGVPESPDFQVTPGVGLPDSKFKMPGEPEKGAPIYVPPIYHREGPGPKSPGTGITPGERLMGRAQGHNRANSMFLPAVG